MERLTAKLVSEDITVICLYAEPDVIGLYNRLGFVANPEGKAHQAEIATITAAVFVDLLPPANFLQCIMAWLVNPGM